MNRTDALIAELQRERPWAVQLAELASPAAHVDPVLLRRLRQRMLPAADPGAEADLWFSTLVSAHEPGACALHDEVVLRLRERIATDPVRCADAIEIIRESHAGLPEALRVEEALTALALQGVTPIEPAVESALQPALRAIASSDASHALEVARWALQAAPRLAPALREAAAMQALLVAAALRVESAEWPAGVQAGRVAAEHLAWLMPEEASALPQVSVGVSLTPTGLRLDAPGPGAPTLELPRTRPVLLSLRWPLAGAWQQLLAPVEIGTELVLPGAPQEVELTTLTGARYRLAAPAATATASGTASPDLAEGAVPAAPMPRLLSIVRSEAGFDFSFAGESSRVDRRTTIRSMPLDSVLARLATSVRQDPGLTIELSKMLLDPDLLGAIAAGSGPLLLHLDVQAARLPWELILWNRDTGDPADRRPVAVQTVLVRQLAHAEAFRVARPNHERTALVIGNPSVEATSQAFIDVGVTLPALPALPGAERACEAVAARLAQGGCEVERVVGEGAKAADVVGAFYRRPWRILHIAAHAIFRPRGGGVVDRIGMLLSDGTVISAAEVEAMEVVPALVFLDGCHAGPHHTDPTLFGQDGQLAAVLARDLLAIGVSCVVVAGRMVEGPSQTRFSDVFYERLMQGATFGDAMLAARLALWREHPQDLSWGAFQAYGDAEHRLGPWTGAAVADDAKLMARSVVHLLHQDDIVGFGVFVAPGRMMTLASVVQRALGASTLPAASEGVSIPLRFDGRPLSGRLTVSDTASPLCLLSVDGGTPDAVSLRRRMESVALPASRWESVAWGDSGPAGIWGDFESYAIDGTDPNPSRPFNRPSLDHPAAERMRVGAANLGLSQRGKEAQLLGAPLMIDGELAGVLEHDLGPWGLDDHGFLALGAMCINHFLRWALRPGEHEPWIALSCTEWGAEFATGAMERAEYVLRSIRLRPMTLRDRSASDAPPEEAWIRALNDAEGAVRVLTPSASLRNAKRDTSRELLMLAYRVWAEPRFPFLALTVGAEGEEVEPLPSMLLEHRDRWPVSTDFEILRRALHEQLDNDHQPSPAPERLIDDMVALARRISPDDEDITAGLGAVAERGLGAASNLLALWLRRAPPDQADQLLEGAAMLALPDGANLAALRQAAAAPPGERAVCVSAMPALIARWLLAKAWYPTPPPPHIVIRDQQWPAVAEVDVLVAQVRAYLCQALECSDDGARWLLAHASAPFAVVFTTRPLPPADVLAALRRALPAALLFFLAGNEPVPDELARSLGLPALEMLPGETSLKLVMDYKQLRGHIDDRAATPAPRDARRPVPGTAKRSTSSPAKKVPAKKAGAKTPAAGKPVPVATTSPTKRRR